MEFGVHGTGWYPQQHNYHPSLPARRLRMLDLWEELGTTVVAWGALGGGGLSLAHLHEEAFGMVDARSRIYGVVNDQEFLDAATRRGIDVFAVAFCAQGWEFPVELDADETTILALNELRGVGRRATLGINEFVQHRYPALWPAPDRWLPDGLYDGDGVAVTDLLAEGCVRDHHGRPRHALWLMCPDREHVCHLMHPASPAWREYLKAIIRIQIDAGADNIQLDEPDATFAGIAYGGCFCRYCSDGFREHLLAVDLAERPDLVDLLGDVDLERFDYGTWLAATGHGIHPDLEATPLFFEYVRFQRRAMVGHLVEVIEFARAYGRRVGRSIRVGANLIGFADRFHALAPHVDLALSEQHRTYNQPAWYRYVAGFCGEGAAVAVMNPYGGGSVVELVDDLRQGRGIDVYRVAMYEAAAHGVSLSIPHGAWMGSVVEDAFYGPHAVSVAIQRFLREHQHLFGESAADTAFVYGVEANHEAMAAEHPAAARLAFFAGFGLDGAATNRLPFWLLADRFAADHQPLDVIVLPDTTVRPDTIEAGQLARYRHVVVPEGRHLSHQQVDALVGYLDAGGQVVGRGSFAENLPGPGDEIVSRPGFTALPADTVAWLPENPQVVIEPETDVAVHVHRVRSGLAVHLVRFAIDPETLGVAALDRLRVSVRTDDPVGGAEVFDPDGRARATVAAGAPGRLDIELREVGLYTIVLLTPALG